MSSTGSERTTLVVGSLLALGAMIPLSMVGSVPPSTVLVDTVLVVAMVAAVPVIVGGSLVVWLVIGAKTSQEEG